MVGDVIDYTVLVTVLPSANLDTADQMFTNSINITDDGLNGEDINPGNNQDSHADMLLSGPGDPAPLMAIDSITQEDISITNNAIFEQPAEQLEVKKQSEPRYISGDAIRMVKTFNDNYEDDVLNGGDLLDTFSNNPVQLCEVHLVENPWSGAGAQELDNDELLDLFVPDDQSMQMDESESLTPSGLIDQFEQESENLFGDSSVDMVELIQNVLLNEKDLPDIEPDMEAESLEQTGTAVVESKSDAA